MTWKPEGTKLICEYLGEQIEVRCILDDGAPYAMGSEVAHNPKHPLHDSLWEAVEYYMSELTTALENERDEVLLEDAIDRREWLRT